jgi:hypothetical protein
MGFHRTWTRSRHSPDATGSRSSRLASTLVIGSQSFPLFAQPLEVVDAWADGFKTVWKALRS